MGMPGFGSPIQTYWDNTHRMRVSNDREGSNPKNLGLLGVVDLDLALSPDVFGLQAFDSKLPLTRMLPGCSPCELRLLLPDSKIGTDGFHDVVIENLSASPAWRSSHVSPADVTSLRRQWPKDVFRTMQRQAKEVERLRRFRSSSAGAGISSQCTRFLLNMPGTYRIGFGYSHDGVPTGVGTVVALPGGVVCGVERFRWRLPWAFQREAWGLSVLCAEKRREVLSPLDGDPGRLAGGSSSGHFGNCGG